VTTAALLARGLTPDTPVPCPPELSVSGKRFGNFEGEAAGVVPFRRDFAISCNTAFVQLSRGLPPDALQRTAAELFGLGTPWRLPLPAFPGSVPVVAEPVDRAAAAIGQGTVLASPLSMALVAAAVAGGTWRPPVLVPDEPSGAEPVSLPGPTVTGLRQLMRAVVTEGSGTALRGLPGEPAGKTGTAEYGSDVPPRTHAWFIGFRGDLAFAVLVEGGGVGGRVAAPLAADFLRRLP